LPEMSDKSYLKDFVATIRETSFLKLPSIELL